MHRHARILWWWVVLGQSDCGKEKGQLLTVVVVVISPPSPHCAGSGLAPGRGRVKLPCVPAANATSPLLRRRLAAWDAPATEVVLCWFCEAWWFVSWWW